MATACAKPPAGRRRWTLTLLADTMVKLTDHDSLSGETVRRRLAENDLKPWRRDMWCIPRVDGEYVARMEDVLDLYAEAPNPARPLVCFDETPVQLIGEVRQPVPAQPGQRERYDYEYRRNGTVNLFVTFDPHRCWRNVKVTDRRAAVDYAHCMRDLVDVHYPDAACIRVVQDNLSIHKPGALYEALAPAEARRILRRLEFHFTPKHASWLNIGRVRDQRAAAPVSRPPHRRSQMAPKRDRSMASGEINPEPASNGCSQPTKPAPNSAAPIQPPPKSQNHWDRPLSRILVGLKGKGASEFDTRHWGVVKCQFAVVWLALRSCSQAAISSTRVCLSGIRRSRHWDDRTPSSAPWSPSR